MPRFDRETLTPCRFLYQGTDITSAAFDKTFKGVLHPALQGAMSVLAGVLLGDGTFTSSPQGRVYTEKAQLIFVSANPAQAAQWRETLDGCIRADARAMRGLEVAGSKVSERYHTKTNARGEAIHDVDRFEVRSPPLSLPDRTDIRSYPLPSPLHLPVQASRGCHVRGSVQVSGWPRVRAVLESFEEVLGADGTVCMHRRKCREARTLLQTARNGGRNELGQRRRGALPAAGWEEVHDIAVENMQARFNKAGPGPDMSTRMLKASDKFRVDELRRATKNAFNKMIKCAPAAGVLLQLPGTRPRRLAATSLGGSL